MTEDRRSQVPRGLVISLMAILGATFWLHDSRIVPADASIPIHVITLAAGTIVGELLPIPRPGGRSVPLSLAVMGMAALLGYNPVIVAALGGVAWLTSAVVALQRGHDVRRGALPARLLGGWAMAGAAAYGELLAPLGRWGIRPDGADLLSFVLVSGVIILFLPAVEATDIARNRGRRAFPRWVQLMQSGSSGAISLAAAASLGALTAHTLGQLTIFLLLLPLLAARAGLLRLVGIRRTYEETIRAMSRLPEQLGSIPKGHGARVGRIATQAGQRLGLDAARLADLERAAHLHELALISLDPGEHAPPEQLAEATAGIIREAGNLDSVADIVHQHGSPSSTSSPAAVLLRLACDLDRGELVLGVNPQETASRLEEAVPNHPESARVLAETVHGDALRLLEGRMPALGARTSRSV